MGILRFCLGQASMLLIMPIFLNDHNIAIIIYTAGV